MNDPSKQNITVTLPSGAVATRIVNAVIGNKPLGWSRHSNSPYFKEKYALWIKADIDKMLESRKNLVYRYTNYKTTTPNSLYLRINQGIRFLCEYLDPQNIYKQFYSDVRIHREKGVGITISFDEVLEKESQGGEFIDATKLKYWRDDLDKYLESESNGEPFYKNGLILNELEIDQLKLELDGLEGIMFSITSSEVKVMKGC